MMKLVVLSECPKFGGVWDISAIDVVALAPVHAITESGVEVEVSPYRIDTIVAERRVP